MRFFLSLLLIFFLTLNLVSSDSFLTKKPSETGEKTPTETPKVQEESHEQPKKLQAPHNDDVHDMIAKLEEVEKHDGVQVRFQQGPNEEALHEMHVHKEANDPKASIRHDRFVPKYYPDEEDGKDHMTKDGKLKPMPGMVADGDHYHKFSDYYSYTRARASAMFWVLLLTLIACQIGLHLWRHRHPSSFKFVSLVGLWTIPILFIFKFNSVLYLFWILFTSINLFLIYTTTKKPLPPLTPRWIYGFFWVFHSLSFRCVVVGYCMFLFELFIARLPQFIEFSGATMLVYGLYFAILTRDCAEFLAERLQLLMGYAKKNDDQAFRKPMTKRDSKVCFLCAEDDDCEETLEMGSVGKTTPGEGPRLRRRRRIFAPSQRTTNQENEPKEKTFLEKLTSYSKGFKKVYHKVISLIIDADIDDQAEIVEKDGSTRIELSCGHVFHRACIHGWTIVGKKDTCPTCGAKVNLQAVVGRLSWNRHSVMWCQLLDIIRYLIVWNPIIFFITKFVLMELDLVG